MIDNFIILFDLKKGTLPTTAIAPHTLAVLCRPLADNFSFIEDYEEPEGAEITSLDKKPLNQGLNTENRPWKNYFCRL